MCDPATIMLAATAVSAIGAGVKGISQIQQANYTAKVADANAKNQTAAAADAQQRGEITLRDQYRRASALKGEQVAAMSANGIDTGFGSALNVQQDTSMLTQDDALNTAENTNREMHGYEINAANYTAQARAASASKLGIIAGTAVDFGSTIASGAQQYGKMKKGL